MPLKFLMKLHALEESISLKLSHTLICSAIQSMEQTRKVLLGVLVYTRLLTVINLIKNLINLAYYWFQLPHENFCSQPLIAGINKTFMETESVQDSRHGLDSQKNIDTQRLNALIMHSLSLWQLLAVRNLNRSETNLPFDKMITTTALNVYQFNKILTWQ